MDKPVMFKSISITSDIDSLIAYFPIPGLGVLPVNAFLIHAEQPVLIDTGLLHLEAEFLSMLRSMIDLQNIKWIWLTHTDADHIGNLSHIRAEAPNIQVITTFLGAGKMNLLQHPTDQIYLLNAGQKLDVGDRELLAIQPPTFDAPETTGLYDLNNRVLFSVDCFGAPLTSPVHSADEIAEPTLCESLIKWAIIDAPWIVNLDPKKFDESLNRIRQLNPQVILSSHLPPAHGMTNILLRCLSMARTAQPFSSPSQAS